MSVQTPLKLTAQQLHKHKQNKSFTHIHLSLSVHLPHEEFINEDTSSVVQRKHQCVEI